MPTEDELEAWARGVIAVSRLVSLDPSGLCVCGDPQGIAGMCNDCFNVGCIVSSPCHWSGKEH